MAEFQKRNQGMVSDTFTTSQQSPTVMQPQVQSQKPVLPQKVQTVEVKPRHKYKNALFGLGISEVVFGSFSVFFGFVTLVIAAENPSYKSNYSDQYYDYYHGFTWASQGIWCGLFLIATGILGIKAKSNPSVGIYKANMAMSIITASIMVPLMVLSGIAAAVISEGYRRSGHLQILVILHSILVIVGFAAAVVCIVHSVYCCAGVCCRRASVWYTPQRHGVQQPQQMVMLANGQYMMVPVQPGVPQTGEAQFVHPTAVYPPLGFQQPLQDQTLAATAEAPPSYYLHQNEQDKTI